MTKLLTTAIIILIALTVYSNYAEQLAVDQSKLPEKVEVSKGFQRWITNLKNKEFEIEADDFVLVEENEIYNTRWMKVTSYDLLEVKEEYASVIAEHQDIKKVRFSPSERAFVDYRHEERSGYEPNEIRFYGLRDDKVIDARFLDCSVRANCYFDRAFFLTNSNDAFFVSEISQDIKKIKDEDGNERPGPPVCTEEEICTYTFKLHVIDLKTNSRLVYRSLPYELILANILAEL
jgi:hypothetical protein